MHVTQTDTVCLAAQTAHCAFTSLARWHGALYCAYREASSHGVVPPGHLVVQVCHGDNAWYTYYRCSLPQTDLRDPRLIATPDMLYMLCGAYVPSPHLAMLGLTGLSSHTNDNQLWTMSTCTRDGHTWMPLMPILRPNHWGWSAFVDEARWCLASYNVGVSDLRNTISLWHGSTLGTLTNYGVMYDGGSLEQEGQTYVYPRIMPSEPVLYRPAPDTLACFLRTETTMLHGIWHVQHGWRWQDTSLLVHPSSIAHTPHGWLLAARELTERRQEKRRTPTINAARSYDASVTLWHVESNRLRKVLTLPDASGDCAYAGLAPGDAPDVWHLSYYSSHDAPIGLADVYVSTLRLQG